MASGPNKTVGNWRRRVGFPPKAPRPPDPFIEWVAVQARTGRVFRSAEQARSAYEQHLRGEQP